jgi:hypothetical protein
MDGVFKLEITETIDQLKTLLNEQKTVFGKERVQALYLLKLGQIKTLAATSCWSRKRSYNCTLMATSISSGRAQPTAAKPSASGAKARYSQMGANSFNQTAF